MAVADLLYLVHRIPYPPNKGDKIRSWNILRRLAERYRVHLGCFVDDDNDWEHIETVKALCGDTRFERLTPLTAKARGALRSLSGLPLSVGYYKTRAFTDWVHQTVQKNRIDRCLIYSSQMAQYVCGPEFSNMRRVIDFVDVDSQKWRQYASMKRWPASWIYRWEAEALLGYDRRIAEIFDASVFVSDAEAEVFRGLVPECAASVHHMFNGVDLDFFDPDAALNPVGLDKQASLVFTGAMDYWANVDAVTWFVSDILPIVQQHVPSATFWIVGSNPTAEVQALGNAPGVTVTGRVADVRPYLSESRAVVAPMRVARGIQNKVLEAMSMAKPVIATSDAVEGIAAESGHQLYVADTASDYAERVIAVLQEPENARLRSNAREFVAQRFSWNANLGVLDSLLDGVSGASNSP